MDADPGRRPKGHLARSVIPDASGRSLPGVQRRSPRACLGQPDRGRLDPGSPRLGSATASRFGTAAAGVDTLLKQQTVLQERGTRKVSPFFLPNMLADAASGQVAIAVGARGPNMAVVSASISS